MVPELHFMKPQYRAPPLWPPTSIQIGVHYMNAQEQIKDYISQHGPSTWSEIQEGTKLSKASLTRAFADDSAFNSTTLPSTLYNSIGMKRPSSQEQIVRHLLRDAGRLFSHYMTDVRKLGREHADTNAETAIHQMLTKYERLLGRGER